MTRRVIYGLALLAGAALFFFSFSAAFAGAWPQLLLLVLAYAVAGAIGVAFGASPGRLALMLAVPAMPWLVWLFPAAVAEAGLRRALLWPTMVGFMLALAWIGGRVALEIRSFRRESSPGS